MDERPLTRFFTRKGKLVSRLQAKRRRNISHKNCHSEPLGSFTRDHTIEVIDDLKNEVRDMWTACQNGDERYLRKALKRNPSFVEEMNGGRSPLYFASLYGNHKIVELLLKAGARDNEGIAIAASLNEECRQLIKRYSIIPTSSRKGTIKLFSSVSRAKKYLQRDPILVQHTRDTNSKVSHAANQMTRSQDNRQDESEKRAHEGSMEEREAPNGGSSHSARQEGIITLLPDIEYLKYEAAGDQVGDQEDECLGKQRRGFDIALDSDIFTRNHQKNQARTDAELVKFGLFTHPQGVDNYQSPAEEEKNDQESCGPIHGSLLSESIRDAQSLMLKSISLDDKPRQETNQHALALDSWNENNNRESKRKAMSTRTTNESKPLSRRRKYALSQSANTALTCRRRRGVYPAIGLKRSAMMTATNKEGREKTRTETHIPEIIEIHVGNFSDSCKAPEESFETSLKGEREQLHEPNTAVSEVELGATLYSDNCNSKLPAFTATEMNTSSSEQDAQNELDKISPTGKSMISFNRGGCRQRRLSDSKCTDNSAYTRPSLFRSRSFTWLSNSNMKRRLSKNLSDVREKPSSFTGLSRYRNDSRNKHSSKKNSTNDVRIVDASIDSTSCKLNHGATGVKGLQVIKSKFISTNHTDPNTPVNLDAAHAEGMKTRKLDSVFDAETPLNSSVAIRMTKIAATSVNATVNAHSIGAVKTLGDKEAEADKLDSNSFTKKLHGLSNEIDNRTTVSSDGTNSSDDSCLKQQSWDNEHSSFGENDESTNSLCRSGRSSNDMSSSIGLEETQSELDCIDSNEGTMTSASEGQSDALLPSFSTHDYSNSEEGDLNIDSVSSSFNTGKTSGHRYSGSSISGEFTDCGNTTQQSFSGEDEAHNDFSLATLGQELQRFFFGN